MPHPRAGAVSEEQAQGWGRAVGCVPARAGAQGRNHGVHLLSPPCLLHRPFAEICTEAKQTGKQKAKK